MVSVHNWLNRSDKKVGVAHFSIKFVIIKRLRNLKNVYFDTKIAFPVHFDWLDEFFSYKNTHVLPTTRHPLTENGSLPCTCLFVSRLKVFLTVNEEWFVLVVDKRGLFHYLSRECRAAPPCRHQKNLLHLFFTHRFLQWKSGTECIIYCRRCATRLPQFRSLK